MTGDEKWIYFQNPNARNFGLIPLNHQYLSQDQITSDGRRCCAFSGIRRVSSTTSCYNLVKLLMLPPTTDQIAPCSAWKKAAYRKRQADFPQLQRTIAYINNGPKLLGDNWEVLSHPAYSPDLTPSDYHLFSSMGHALAERHFDSYEDVRKWLDEWFASKDEEFFWRGIHKLPERWEKCS